MERYMKHITLLDDAVHVDLSGDSSGDGVHFASKFAVFVQEAYDDAAAQAVIQAAKDAGLDSVYLLDKRFVLDALREKVERENPRQLTEEELLRLHAPVWCACQTLEGTDGFWCLCRRGYILPPSGQEFYVKNIPNWKLFLHRPIKKLEV